MSENGQGPRKDEPPAELTTQAADSVVNGVKTSSPEIPGSIQPDLDDFGLPVRKRHRLQQSDKTSDEETWHQARGHQDGAQGVVTASTDEKRTSPSADDEPPDPASLPEASSTSPPRLPGDISHAPVPDNEDVRDESTVLSSHQRILSVPTAVGGVSEWSHQILAPHKVEVEEKAEEEWQDMPAFAPYDMYDDNNKLIAREAQDSDDEANAYAGLGGAGKGYTRVQIDEDAKSATSMDENTSYLFKEIGTNVVDDDEEHRDPLAQMQATKDLLTEGQRIAYVGVTRLAMVQMVKELEDIDGTKGTKKELRFAIEAMKMWSQKMMVRLYAHMDIDPSEQIMIEQLAEHGVQPEDLTPVLMQNSRVKNPMADNPSPIPTSVSRPSSGGGENGVQESSTLSGVVETIEILPPSPYGDNESNDLPEVRTPSQLPTTKNLDIDLRWTVLCDLFLVLVADSIYDSRSRVLLERVGGKMDVSWLEICRFEKRVTDALEMQEAANKETWDEADHMESRRKMALKRKYMMMGLATVGGSLVIGLSAGLLAPVIGAGLAAGFTTIGVAGTSGFLAGAGGTALITSGAVLSGGTIAVRAAHRRTGAVKTFEYRPLHNNKRVNLIVTISGWMNGKIDDVRLPYSTVDPIMGDMYSVLWEPEMLQSMGDTINILATEALTQGLQQVLGSTILVALMASLQLPIVLTKLSYLIDNPWTVSLDRAQSAGLILADSVIDRNLGARPITLVGFSLGSRVIFSCLLELANKAAFGLIQNVYLFGSPVVAKKDDYLRARTVVSGRFVNGYASNDWILGYLFRATSGGIMRVAGLAPVEEIPGLENIDVTKIVNGHMAYRAAMPKLLREVGWEVESDEFTEIEDPDPENHEKRQRELIREIDEARKEAEQKSGKKRFVFFKRGKPAEKKGWETYDERMREGEESSSDGPNGSSRNVLFDIEAIRAELASEQIEVKQLESTLGPMKLDLNRSSSSLETPQPSPHSNPMLTKSYDDDMALRTKSDPSLPQPSLSNSHASGPAHADDFDHNSSNLPNGGYANGTENIQMSFDTDHPPSTPAELVDSPSVSAASPARPGLRSSATMPAGTGPSGLSLERNAWADEDDEDFGKEKEVQMSFESR